MTRPEPQGSLDGPGGSKAFAKKLVSMFRPLGVNATRFSVVSFAADATTRVGWSYDETEINDGIDDMTADGKTSISDGFEAVRHLFDEIDDSDTRENSIKVVLLLSDGEQTIDAATGKTLMQTAIDAATLVKDQGATVFAWGFGQNISNTTLIDISTNGRAILARNVSELVLYLDGLKADICGDSQPMVGAPCPPPSPPPPSPPPPSPPSPSPPPPSPPSPSPPP
eukprot:scaffold27836_cov50-Phaeocystis_antarctica.AAC.1